MLHTFARMARKQNECRKTEYGRQWGETCFTLLRADSLAPAVACGIGCRAARRDPPASAHARRPSNAARGHPARGRRLGISNRAPAAVPKVRFPGIVAGYFGRVALPALRSGEVSTKPAPRRAGCLASEGRPASRIRQGEAVTSKGRAEPSAWPLTAWTVWRRLRTSDCEGRLRSRCRAQGEPGNATGATGGRDKATRSNGGSTPKSNRASGPAPKAGSPGARGPGPGQQHGRKIRNRHLTQRQERR